MPLPGCSIVRFVGKFRAAFTGRSFAVAVPLVVAIVLVAGAQSLAARIRVLKWLGVKGHFSRFYRFFTSDRWFVEVLTRLLVLHALRQLQGQPVYLVVDDTLIEHGGPQIWGIGMHYDAVQSGYGRRGRRRIVRIACGHNWVIVSVLVPTPWNPRGWRALPVAAKLYRNAKQAGNEYRKRTELAVELVELILRAIPPGVPVYLLGDSTYTCRTVAHALRHRVHLVGPLPRDAALSELPTPSSKPSRGRPRKYGERLPSPAELFEASTTAWRKTTVCMYGRRVKLRVAERVAQWRSVFGAQPVRIVLARAEDDSYRPMALVCADPSLSAEQVLEVYSRRWTAEVMHREVKQQLGAGAIQNGWYRRVRRASKRLPKPPGIRSHPTRGRRAVERTLPFLLFIYSLIHLWYFQANRYAADVALHRKAAPWYRHKTTPSFADMLSAARAELLADFLSDPSAPGFQEKLHHLIRAIAAPG